jgi:hypothetical protein
VLVDAELSSLTNLVLCDTLWNVMVAESARHADACTFLETNKQGYKFDGYGPTKDIM